MKSEETQKNDTDVISLEVRPEIVAKASPDFENIDARAVAGVSELDVIERNVIARLEEQEGEDEDDQEEGRD